MQLPEAGLLWKIEAIDPLDTQTAQLQIESTVTIWKLVQLKYFKTPSSSLTLRG